MSSQKQSSYIADLAVVKTREFKEVKELLKSTGIVGDDATIVDQAESIAQITDALTDLQASQFITALIESKTPERSRVYSDKRIQANITGLDNIKKEIDDWDFS